MFYRDSWIELDLDRLQENIRLLIQRSGKSFFAVIKANGYGAGDCQIARAALEAGAQMLAVSSLDEALSLRAQGIDAPILILGVVDPSFSDLLIRHQLTVPAVSLSWAQQIVQHPVEGLKVHLKADTGMGRIGSSSAGELKEMADLLETHGVQIEGIFTHFACSDAADNRMCDLQMERFAALLKELNRSFRWIHCDNSDAAVHYPDSISNAVRCGIAMFGITSYTTPLQPCLSLYSRLVHVKQVEAGTTIGYGATYASPQREWIGTLPIGYADGWIRRHQGRCCIIDGVECEFVGRICMDQAMIRLPHEMPVGTRVELIGPHMPIERVARELDTIPYEVMTLLSDRLAKVYLRQNGVCEIVNPRLDRLMSANLPR